MILNVRKIDKFENNTCLTYTTTELTCIVDIQYIPGEYVIDECYDFMTLKDAGSIHELLLYGAENILEDLVDKLHPQYISVRVTANRLTKKNEVYVNRGVTDDFKDVAIFKLAEYLR
jgi:hypothetical protein